MERRIGTVLIYVENREAAPEVNAVLSRHAGIIICRQGFPREQYSLISVIFEGTTDEIGSLTGQLGRIKGIEVKSVLLKKKPMIEYVRLPNPPAPFGRGNCDSPTTD